MKGKSVSYDGLPAGQTGLLSRYKGVKFVSFGCLPQTPSFNRGYWGDFEEFIRTLVIPSERSIKAAAAEGHSQTAFKDVYVITGPLFLPSKEPASPTSFNGETKRVARSRSGYCFPLVVRCLHLR